MATMRYATDELLIMAMTMSRNGRSSVELAARLARVGFDEARLIEGETLMQQVELACSVQDELYGHQQTATMRLNDLWRAAREAYAQHVQLARLALKADRTAWGALGLNGKRAADLAGWLAQARQFYRNALADAQVMAQLARYGLDAGVFQTMEGRIAEVEQAHHARETARSAAVRSTREREAAVAALRAWVGELRQVARIAVGDERTLLAAIGMDVPADRR